MIGIYRLVFNNTSQCYVGQSIHIEHRYEQHLVSFNNKTAKQKLLNAFIEYGIPELEILCECDISELNSLELEAIEIFDSYNNGFNSINTVTPVFYGEKHGRSKYSNEQIIEVAKLLTDPNNRGLIISQLTGVSLDTVQGISSLKVHAWIKDVVPDIYAKLIKLKNTRKNPKGLNKRGITYPPVISPDGIVYSNIDNLSHFCEKHGLSRSNFRKVLTGKTKSSLGWKLVV